MVVRAAAVTAAGVMVVAGRAVGVRVAVTRRRLGGGNAPEAWLGRG